MLHCQYNIPYPKNQDETQKISRNKSETARAKEVRELNLTLQAKPRFCVIALLNNFFEEGFPIDKALKIMLR